MRRVLTKVLIFLFCLMASAGAAWAEEEVQYIDISEYQAELSLESAVYTGEEVRPEVKVSLPSEEGEMILEEGTDYNLEYEDNIRRGTAKVIVTGTGQYEGQIVREFEITPRSMEGFTLRLAGKSLYTVTYTGKNLRPAIAIYDGKKLVSPEEYKVTVSGSDGKAAASCINVGEYLVTVSASEDGNYEGAVTGTFTIKRKKIHASDVSLSQNVLKYTGKVKKPSVTVKSGNLKLKRDKSYQVTYSNEGKRNYRGYATVTVKGTGNYTGTVKKKFKILSVKKQVKNCRSYCRWFTRSLYGYCGLLSNRSMYNLGIATTYIEANGNQCWGLCRKREYISDQYAIKSYSHKKYSLKKALNKITDKGSRNVTNVLVCFDKSGTYQGRRYGHVFFIHAIIGGKVYYSECFGTFYDGRWKGAGRTLVCSIDELADRYSRSKGFLLDGVVWYKDRKLYN